MMLLKECFGSNGMHLKQVKRTNNIALYSAHLTENDKPVGFEVWKIKIAKPAEMFGRSYPEREVAPNNEDFGTNAWSWKSYEQANAQFMELSVQKEIV